ncbi:MAG TPA: NADH:flavin oxidoreductase [Xanthobacteraceae bacterium]|nr:NADH:flavin oxidoreductase [Xanthobacteraceae bacterium]
MREAVTGPGVRHYPVLFSSGALGPLKLDNRAVVSPMTRTSATADGHATAAMADYYRDFARRGWGLIVTEAAYVDLAYSQGYANQPGIASESHARAWRPVVEAAHREGAPILMQIFHAGAINQGNHWVKGSIAPSAVRPLGEQIARYGGSGPFQVPREITRAEMAEIVAGFAAAARRAVAAGFDGIEVHGANGYLPDQFLTTYTNHRTDEYGGAVENRVRFHCEIMRAVRDAVPPQYPVGVRISQTKVNDLAYAWPGGVDDAAAIFSALAKTGIDFIDVSAHLGCDPVFGTDESLAGLAKKFSGLTVMANGKLHDPAKAEELLSAGQADFAAIAKGALADPAWPRKIAAGEAPVAFDPEMISPLATLDNTAAWRRRRGIAA